MFTNIDVGRDRRSFPVDYGGRSRDFENDVDLESLFDEMQPTAAKMRYVLIRDMFFSGNFHAVNLFSILISCAILITLEICPLSISLSRRK